MGYEMTINFGIRLDGMVFCKLLGLRFFFPTSNMETPGCPEEDCMGWYKLKPLHGWGLNYHAFTLTTELY